MRLLAAVLVVLGVVAGVGVYFGVESFQGGETPKGGPEDLTPGPEFAQGSRDESDCIWATPPPYADTDEVICVRECPECFPALPPGVEAERFLPCPEQDASLPLPDYSSLAKPDTKAWQRYESPNYPWTFLYPQKWTLEIIEYSDLYGDVKGPTREVLRLWSPGMSPDSEVRTPDAAVITIDHGPRPAGVECSPQGRYEEVDVSLAERPTLLVTQASRTDESERVVFTAYAAIRVSEEAFVHFVLGTETSSHLATARAILESMAYGPGVGE
jgi:hypothetical protein